MAMPILLPTMTGARSGRTLTSPLCCSQNGDRIVIIAWYDGARRNRPWCYNLLGRHRKIQGTSHRSQGSGEITFVRCAGSLDFLFQRLSEKDQASELYSQIPILVLTCIE
jgi:hypothetical protein